MQITMRPVTNSIPEKVKEKCISLDCEQATTDYNKDFVHSTLDIYNDEQDRNRNAR